MTQSLLAAEADKIQDLIFRASKLREVVGGSQLLSRFEDDDDPSSAFELLRAKIAPTSEVVTAGGGSFRVLFATEAAAHEFGYKLAEVYRLATGGLMSVAQPVPYDGDYHLASEKAEAALRRAKISGGHGRAVEHLPYIAFCASCGTALANEFDATAEKYLCPVCRAKGNERRVEQADKFLKPFYREVIGQDNDQGYDWPGKDFDLDPPGEVARFDARSYVAYLVADGNNMGKVFGQCEREQAQQLSRRLSPLLLQCLAQPTRMLLTTQPEFKDRKFIPVLPLILGGDDLFALLPAKWAIDFAGRFCRAYDEAIVKELKDLGLSFDPSPTMAAAVVICKANYPYYLAYQIGHDRLKEAKKLAKLVALDTGKSSSVVNFEIVRGSQLVHSSGAGNSNVVRDSLRPYWLSEAIPPKWGLPLETMLNQRKPLSSLPRRRHAQLRHYFSALHGMDEVKADERKSRLEQILRRIAREEEDEQNLKAVMQALGDADSGWLREVETNTHRWLAHGLPDLLDAWDFTLKVDEIDLGEESCP